MSEGITAAKGRGNPKPDNDSGPPPAAGDRLGDIVGLVRLALWHVGAAKVKVKIDGRHVIISSRYVSYRHRLPDEVPSDVELCRAVCRGFMDAAVDAAVWLRDE